MRNSVNAAWSTIWGIIGPFLMFLVLGAVYVIGMSILTLGDMLRHAFGYSAGSLIAARGDSASVSAVGRTHLAG